MKRCLLVTLAVCVLVGCGAEPTPTPDLVATQIAVEKAAHATMTAEVLSGTEPPTPTSVPEPTVTYVTLDGYDPDAGITVEKINLWVDFHDRNAGVAAVGKHGEEVKLIRRQGDGVLVGLANGKQGWVTYYFIKELKAPKSTDAPTPTHISTATVTPTEEATEIPTATATDTPTATATPTVIPVVVPDGWKGYEHFSGRFSVAHPADWTVSDEGPSSVTFKGPKYVLFSTGIYQSECGINLDPDPQEAQQCLAVTVADAASSLDTFQLAATDVWDDGIHEGYVVETREEDYVYEIWSYGVWVFIPIQDDPDSMIGAIYSRVATKSITDAERERMSAVIGSFRLGRTTAEPNNSELDTTLPEPTIASVESSEGDEPPGVVIRSVADVVDGMGWYNLYGEVLNRSEQSIGQVKILGNFYSASGQLIKTEEIYTGLHVVEPGESVPFDFFFTDLVQVVDSYELEILEAPTAKARPLGLEIVREEGYMTDSNRHRITGEVRNPHDFTVEWPFIYATYYNEDNEVVGVDFASADLGTLEPGQSSTFEIIFVDPAGLIDHYKLQTQAERR